MIAEAAALDEKVLVLNRIYTAIRVVDARRAFVMLCKQAAEVIAVEDGQYFNYDFETWTEISELQKQLDREAYTWVRTPTLEIAVPKIVRLFGYDRVPKREIKLNRRNIYHRDHNRCQYCGMRFNLKELTIDHIVPRVQGGGNTWDNLVCACVHCNTRKGGRTPRQAHMKLVRAPFKPKHNPAMTIKLGSKKYQSWKAFLNDAYWTVELRD